PAVDSTEFSFIKRTSPTPEKMKGLVRDLRGWGADWDRLRRTRTGPVGVGARPGSAQAPRPPALWTVARASAMDSSVPARLAGSPGSARPADRPRGRKGTTYHDARCLPAVLRLQ